MEKSPSMAFTINSCAPASSTATGNTSDSIHSAAIRTLGNQLLGHPQRCSQRQDTIVETSQYDYSSQLSTIQHTRYRSEITWFFDLKPKPNWPRNRSVAPNAARSSGLRCAANVATSHRSDSAFSWQNHVARHQLGGSGMENRHEKLAHIGSLIPPPPTNDFRLQRVFSFPPQFFAHRQPRPPQSR